MIEIIDLHVRYSGRPDDILKGINAEFSNKHIILGPNGSGKTTLFRAIAGLAPITSGKILIDGIDIEKIYGKKGILSINMFEALNLLSISAYDNIKLMMDLTAGDVDLAFNIMEDLGIHKDILRKRKPWELSAGQLKAYTTSIALASNARHILLDEPFEQLDPARKSRLVKHLKEYKGIILINTHETWVLNAFKDWASYLVFEGRLYGPIESKKLLEANLAIGEEDDALLVFNAGGRIYNLVMDKTGKPLSELLTLDRIYELAI